MLTGFKLRTHHNRFMASVTAKIRRRRGGRAGRDLWVRLRKVKHPTLTHQRLVCRRVTDAVFWPKIGRAETR